jgi:feruloyl-CoA synthase
MHKPLQKSSPTPIRFLPARIDTERRADGTIILRSPEPLGRYIRCWGEYLERWAGEKPDHVFLAQRHGDSWRKITWAETRRQVYAIGTALLQRAVSADHPVAVLSENSIEHALLMMAAMHVGVPIAPISPAYSLVSKDFEKLRTVINLIEPRLIYVDSPGPFEKALSAISHHEFELITADTFASLMLRTDEAAVRDAFDAVRPETITKFLFTSGSTGQPKAVINTQRMVCSNIQSRAQAWPFLEEEAPVVVDWLPWNHTFGGNNDFGLVLAYGGTLYIDGGKPLPGLIETTVRNLSDVSPTICFNAPRGYDALLPFLRNDAKLRRSFFRRLKVMLFGAAALPSHVWDELERLSLLETGKRVHICAGWGSTETAPVATLVHFDTAETAVIGLPTPGCELKMIPVDNDGRYELRVRGPNVMPGYWKRPDLTAQVFDEEGFYKIGDAGRFADTIDPAKGIAFAGRLTEDFKLTNGTWVHVGALRPRAIAALSAVAQDIVIAGHDRDNLGFLIFPKPGTNAADAGVQRLVKDGMTALRDEYGTCSTYATRAILLQDPPSIDAGEITDKGYINQRAVLTRRASLVEMLYSETNDETVIRI